MIATAALGESINTVGLGGAALFLSALGIAAVTPPEPQDASAAAAAATENGVHVQTKYLDYQPTDDCGYASCKVDDEEVQAPLVNKQR